MTFKIDRPVKSPNPQALPPRIDISCSQEFKDRVVAVAKKQGVTVAYFGRQAIQYALDNMEDET